MAWELELRLVFVSVMVVRRGVPPGTWLSAPVRALMPQLGSRARWFWLLASFRVEVQVVWPLASASWMVTGEDELPLTAARLKPPRVTVALAPSATIWLTAASRPAHAPA